MKDLKCPAIRMDEGITMMRLINKDTLDYVDVVAPRPMTPYSQTFVLMNGAVLSGRSENSPLGSFEATKFDYFFLFEAKFNGGLIPITDKEGNCVGYGKNREMLFINPETNDVIERFDPIYDTNKKEICLKITKKNNTWQLTSE